MARRKSRLDDQQRKERYQKANPKQQNVVINCTIAEVHPRRD